ncbi:MAG TPA: 6-phosphogluconolactonase [Desulfocapsa sulfexigens]|nr:6-phosphogluconolactonase [Desulfocapsa sulfexigens]
MKPKIDLYSFPDHECLINELTHEITEILKSGVEQNRRASLAVSGGRTPGVLFEALSLTDIPWQNVDITLVDERWVDPTDSDSNEHLVRSHLLQNNAAAAHFTGMKNLAATAGEGESECEKQLKKISRPFDVLILGMGNDGHTASLFPGAEKLPQATDMNSGKTCMAIAPLTAPHERMTLTLPAILESRKIFLHITGQGKKDVLDKALADGAAADMPIRFILRRTGHKLPVSVFWAK